MSSQELQSVRNLENKHKYFLALDEVIVASKEFSEEDIKKIIDVVVKYSKCETSWYYDAATAIQWFLEWHTFGVINDHLEEAINSVASANFESWIGPDPTKTQEVAEKIRILAITSVFNEMYNCLKDN